MTLREYIENEILPRYSAFDKGHQRDHAESVIYESLVLAEAYGADKEMAYTIAAFHDLGLEKGRELHHIYSGEILMADSVLPQFFSKEQLLVMREAVEDHRASSSHEPRSIYGKIVAEADRIIDPHVTLLRTVQYGLAHYPQLSKDQHYQRFVQHMHEKYADGGYLKLWIPQSSNAARLKELRAIVADESKLAGIFEKLWENEAGRNKIICENMPVK